MSSPRFSRRKLLRMVSAAGATATTGALLAACAPPAAPAAAPTAGATTAPVATPEAAATAAATTEATTAATTATEAPTAVVELAATSDPATHKSGWVVKFPAAGKKYDPPIKITSPMFADKQYFKPDEDYTNNVMTRRIKEVLGIEYVPAWQIDDGDLRNQRLTADMAGGTLPDVFPISGTNLALMIENDAVEDIRAIFDATASELVKSKLEYPKGRMNVPVTRGEKLFGIPFTYGGYYEVDNLGFIRKDLLDKAGLAVPTTIDELTTAMKTLKEKGLVTYGLNACKNLVTWYNSVDPIFAAYGVMPTAWRKTADGTLAYDSISPGVKTALGVLRGWYADGLIDPDYYTKDEGGAAENFQQGKTLLHFAPYWASSYTNTAMKDNPQWKFDYAAPPKGPDGKSGRKLNFPGSAAECFRKGIEADKVEAVIHHLNWTMDIHVNADKYNNYGFGLYAWEEGYEYVWDGDELKEGPHPRTDQYLYNVGGAWPNFGNFSVTIDRFNQINKWATMPADQLNAAQRYLISNVNTLTSGQYLAEADKTKADGIIDEFYGSPNEDMTKLLPELKKLEDETFNGIVTGSKSLDDFDAFVATWKSSGGDTVTAGVNAWFKSLAA